MMDMSAMLDVQSGLTDGSRDTNVEKMELKRKYEALLADVSRKKYKRSRKFKDMRDRKKVKDIPENRHLGNTQKYQLSRLMKNVVWKCIKFWHVELEKRQCTRH